LNRLHRSLAARQADHDRHVLASIDVVQQAGRRAGARHLDHHGH